MCGSVYTRTAVGADGNDISKNGISVPLNMANALASTIQVGRVDG